jgi:hypothetical protein
MPRAPLHLTEGEEGRGGGDGDDVVVMMGREGREKKRERDGDEVAVMMWYVVT